MEFRSQLLPPVLRLLRAADLDVQPLIRKYELPPDAIERKEVLLPVDRWRAFSNEAAALLNDDALGLHLAQLAPRGTYGVLEFTARSAPNLREALLRISRYSTLVNSLSVIAVEEQGAVARYVQRMPGEPQAAGPVGNVFSTAVIVRIARELTGADLKASAVWFAHDQPRPVAELSAYYGTTELHFDAKYNAFQLDAAMLELPVVSADPDLLVVLEEQAKALAATRAKPSDLRSQVEEQVRRLLTEGEPVIGTVAKALGTSARTLQRRLSEQQLTFNDLVDDVRAQMSKELLKNADLALGEIAFLLGYSEMSPFVRAFKRWTGTTPGEYRQSVR